MAERMAVTPGGEVKPVADFTAKEKWWCDGEDCGGLDDSGKPVPPHVHCEMHTHLVDLLTGRSVDEPEADPE